MNESLLIEVNKKLDQLLGKEVSGRDDEQEIRSRTRIRLQKMKVKFNRNKN